jgi:hypothetical protein
MVLKTSSMYQIGSNFYKSSNQFKPSRDVLHAEDMYSTIQVIDGSEETIVLLKYLELLCSSMLNEDIFNCSFMMNSPF